MCNCDKVKGLEKEINMLKNAYKNGQKAAEECLNKISGQKSRFNESWKPERKEIYFYIDDLGIVYNEEYRNTPSDNLRLENGNCFKTYGQAEQRAKEIKVYNLLKNFSMANGEDKINWKSMELKWYIYYAESEKEFKIGNIYDRTIMDAIFYSKEVAEEAFRLYKAELEELWK